MSNLKKDILPIPIKDIPTSLVNYLLKLTETINNANDYLDYSGENEVSAKQILEHINSKENPHQVTKNDVGLGNVENIKNNIETHPPTPAHDVSKGYSIGSRWLNLSVNKMYICFDNTANNAVWVSISEPTNETITGYINIDGGSASSIYTLNQAVDGGNAVSVYYTGQTIDGGGA